MPAGKTYEPIATTTFSTTTASVTYSSFSGYTDLRIIVNARGTSSNQDVTLQFNSDTGNNYGYIDFFGNSVSVGSGYGNNENVARISYSIGDAVDIYDLIIIDVFNYANTTTRKTLFCQSAGDNLGAGVVNKSANTWRNTSAITSIKIACSTGSFAAGDNINLYGIKNSA